MLSLSPFTFSSYLFPIFVQIVAFTFLERLGVCATFLGFNPIRDFLKRLPFYGIGELFFAKFGNIPGMPRMKKRLIFLDRRRIVAAFRMSLTGAAFTGSDHFPLLQSTRPLAMIW